MHRYVHGPSIKFHTQIVVPQLRCAKSTIPLTISDTRVLILLLFFKVHVSRQIPVCVCVCVCVRVCVCVFIIPPNWGQKYYDTLH